MTKILHVYKSYFPETRGGIEQFISTLSRANIQFGNENTLLTTTSSTHLTPLPKAALTVIRAHANLTIASCPFSLSFINKFKQLCKTHSVIHLHFPWPYGELITYLLAQRQHRIIVTYHADITRQKYLKYLYQPLMHRLLNRAQHIVATSSNLLHSSPTLQCYQHKSSVIPLALNLADYPRSSDPLKQYWRQQVGDQFVLFIGQFRYYKGIAVLLQALQGTQIPCVLIGDGPIKAQCQQLAQQLTINPVHFVGAVDDTDKIALIELSRAVVLPSIARSEAFGLSLLEGLAFDKPLISTELGTGTSYVNQHEHTGLVVPPNDPPALRAALQKIMSCTKTYTSLQQATRSHFQQNFDLQRVAQQYQQLYKNGDS